MNYLLDTSSLLWFIYDDERLSATAAQLLGNSRNTIFLSLASVWEIAIKANLGRGLLLRQPFSDFVAEQVNINRFQLLDISLSRIRRDPFDRLIIAQSLVEGLPVITSDHAFDGYQIQRFW